MATPTKCRDSRLVLPCPPRVADVWPKFDGSPAGHGEVLFYKVLRYLEASMPDLNAWFAQVTTNARAVRTAAVVFAMPCAEAVTPCTV
jgi:hypothetical protein